MPKNIFPKSTCYSGLNENKIPLNASLNKLRQALMLKACIALVEDTSTFGHFKEKYKISKLDSISKAFYNSKVFSFKNSSTKDAVVEICISKGWQKI